MENRTYTKLYRIMHWAIAICILLLLCTIFLRMTWLNKEHVADIIQEYNATVDISLTRDQLIVLAKKIRKPMWDWHIYLGYALLGLYIIRMSLPFLGYMKISNPRKQGLASKTRFHYWMYIIFYVCLAVSLVTGLFIVWGPKSLKNSFEFIHKLSIYYLIPYIIIHLTGVLWAEFTDRTGIVSKIISGQKQPPNE
jgi:cytochrome b561